MPQRVLKFEGTGWSFFGGGITGATLSNDISSSLVNQGWGVRAFNFSSTLAPRYSFELYINAAADENAERVKLALSGIMGAYLNQLSIDYVGDDVYQTNADQTVTVLPTYDKTKSSQGASNLSLWEQIFGQDAAAANDRAGLSGGVIIALAALGIVLLLKRK